jgi:hypothetical protein
MAAISDGQNAGRTGHPARQSPSRKYNGRAEGGDPTNMPGQPATEVFGQRAPVTTGAPGSSGGSMPSDVTLYPGQLDSGLAQVSGSEITDTGAPGSQGARSSSGGEAITYTDPFGFMGGVNREVTVRGKVDGDGDWTQFGEGSGFQGPTLPILVNNRPTDSGAGKGHVSTHRKGA